jgi:ATP-dependent RNA helicase DHX29
LYLHADADELRREGPLPEPVVDSAPPPPTSGRRGTRSSNGKNNNSGGAPSPSPSLAKGSSPPLPSKLSRTPSSTTAPTVGARAAAATTAEQEAALRARILAYGEEVEKALNSTDGSSAENGKAGGEEDDEEEEGGELTALPDANVKYAKLKVQLSEIQRAQAAQKRATKGKGDRKGTEPVSSEQERWMEAQVDVLKDKIQTVESDYTFRKVDAGAFCFIVPFPGMTKTAN